MLRDPEPVENVSETLMVLAGDKEKKEWVVGKGSEEEACFCGVVDEHTCQLWEFSPCRYKSPRSARDDNWPRADPRTT